jgi:hypothetical protein
MDDNKKMIPVFSGSQIEVQKLRHDLEESDIEVMIKNYDDTASITGFANISRAARQLWILETEIENAKPIVEKFKEQFRL